MFEFLASLVVYALILTSAILWLRHKHKKRKKAEEEKESEYHSNIQGRVCEMVKIMEED
jgi:hypothetical protein